MLIGAAIVLSLIVLLLAMPVTLTYEFSSRDTASAKVRLDWAFGLVHADVSPNPAKSGRGDAEAARQKAGRQRKAKGRRANVMGAIRRPSFRRRVFRFVSDLWRAIHRKNVELRVRLGLGDPADTGRLWAVLGPLSGTLARLRDMKVAIEPDFVDATLEVDSRGTIRIVPLRITGLVLGLLLSPPIWMGIVSMRTSG